MKKKRKVPKQAPIFREPMTHQAYVVVYDPECPGIGKGKEINLEKIAFLEFQNLFQLGKTYMTGLKDQIWSLVAKEQELRTAEEYILGMKVISQSGRIVNWKGKSVGLQIIIGYNPKDISDDEAKRLGNFAYDDWSTSFPKFQGSFLIYNFSEKKEYPPKMVLIYVGCEPLKEKLTIDEFSKCWFALLASEELREKTGITLGVRKVALENGEWRFQLE
jgi:hypothetical protein